MLQLGARFYWPEIGRFVSQDPIGDGMNWYVYVGNRPTAYVDADGEVPAALAAVFAIPGVGEAALGVAAVGGAVYMITHPEETKAAISSAAASVAAATSAVADAVGSVVCPARPRAPAEHPDAPKWRARGMPPPPPGARKIPRSPDYRDPRTGERWYPEPNHPQPKGPHWRVTDEKTGRWLRDVSL